MPRTEGQFAKTQVADGVSVRAPGLIVDAEPLTPEMHLRSVALEAMAPAGDFAARMFEGRLVVLDSEDALKAMAPAHDFAAREGAALQAEELTPHRSALRLRVSQPALALAESSPRLATPASKEAHVELSVDADPGDHVLARVQRGKVVQWYLPILQIGRAHV